MYRFSLKIAVVLFAVLAGFSTPAVAQSVDGKYTGRSDDGAQITVELKRLDNGTYTGYALSNGQRFELTGKIDDDLIVGFLRSVKGRMAFEAELDGKSLDFIVFAMSATGRVDYNRSTDFTLARTGPVSSDLLANNKTLPSSATQNLPNIDQQQKRGLVIHRGGKLKAPDEETPNNATLVKKFGPNSPVGTFSDGQITVRLIGANNSFQGDAIYNGQTYPLKVTSRNGVYYGHYRDQGQRYPLQIAVSKDQMTVITADGQFLLKRLSSNTFARKGSHRKALSNNLAGKTETQRRGYKNLAKSGLDDGTAKGREWSQWLAGKKVTRMSSYSSGSAGGYSARTDVHLCGNGQFGMRGNSTVTADTGGVSGYSGGNQAGQGRWQILTRGNRVGIRLNYNNGQTELYELQYRGGKTFANGERVFVTPSTACR